MSNGNDFGTSLAAECWKNAEDLWGDFKHTDFGKIILPFTLLRRLECVLELTRQAVRDAYKQHADSGIDTDVILRQTAGYPFYNTSEYSLATLGSTKTRQNLQDYIARFSANARVIFEQFDFTNTIVRLDRANLLFRITRNFADIELHPEQVPERVMSNLYEHLIRRFGAEVNEGAEDFMTPRDVVHLATTLLLDPDAELFEANPGLIRTLYDPTCGTGGFLSDAMSYVADYGNRLKVPPVLIPYGQELEPETHAVSLANMLLRQHPSDPSRDLSKNIKGPASTLSQDAYAGEHFHYGLANPPFGKKWEKDKDAVVTEHEERGFDGRFGPGLPRVSDGSMLFLMHLASKLEKPENGGGRAAIVLSGSPLFNGGAGSGESEIRRWLLENDRVDAIVALPTEIFFRTGIGTYLWILSNKKPAHRQGKVQLIDATNQWESIKNEGNKRRRISADQQRDIADIYAAFEDGKRSKIFDYQHFGYRKYTIERPLRLDVDLARIEPEQFDSTDTLDRYFLWMTQTNGADCRTRLEEISDEVARHVEESEGLTALKTDPNASKEDIKKAEKACKKLLKVLLDDSVHQDRHILVALLRSLRRETQPTTWDDYNAFHKALETHAKSKDIKLTAANIKQIRCWVARINPDAAPVIAKDVTKSHSRADKLFGRYEHDGHIVTYEADKSLNDGERVPLGKDIKAYMQAEVWPHVPDAWVNDTKADKHDGMPGVVGYEINFNRYFYQYRPPRPLEVIDAELAAVEKDIADLLNEVVE